MYDETNNKQYRSKVDSEQHIYSNSVDNVYDRASQAMHRTPDEIRKRLRSDTPILIFFSVYVVTVGNQSLPGRDDMCSSCVNT